MNVALAECAKFATSPTAGACATIDDLSRLTILRIFVLGQVSGLPSL